MNLPKNKNRLSRHLLKTSLLCTAVVGGMLTLSAQAAVLMKPTATPALDYPQALTPAKVNPAITPPEQVLGFPVGKQTATPEQINQLVALWAKESDKIVYQQYATSYEGRPLHLLAISSTKNLAKLPDIQQKVQQLANPSGQSSGQLEQIVNDLPAIAWMAYSIHGNESSGADAALALIYQLIAADDPKITELLDNMVVLVDPMMNPDGRARFTKMLEQHRGTAPNVDGQSMLHAGVWPYGRSNHYYYDLNRDFYLLQAPETRGRVALINQWYPQLMIDGHEMGSSDTFLFGPSREPINSNIPQSKHKWGKIFAKDQAAGFDQKKWTYYTGEWFENLYPGYSNYAEYRGAVHILYEQARTAEDGIRLENGLIRTYAQSVHHQLQSSLSNLETLAAHSKDIYRDFVKDRQLVTSSDSPYADKSYVILPTANRKRLEHFVSLLQAQNIDVQQTSAAISVREVTDQLGQKFTEKTLPKGALVIRARQPEARLLNAILEFNATIKDEVLLEEYQRTLRDGSSVMYDNTAWNLTMMLGLNAWEVGQDITQSLQDFAPHPLVVAAAANADADQHNLGWLVNGDDDASVGFAARLMEQGVQVRLINKAGVLGKLIFNRGTIAVLKSDNPQLADLAAQVATAAKDVNTDLQSLMQGLGDGDLPDIGGSHFELLQAPKLAIVGQGGVSQLDFGAIWHMVDTHLGIRHSHLDLASLLRDDLRQYNVIVLPHMNAKLDKGQLAALSTWVEAGGTLISIDGATGQLLSGEISTVKPLAAAIGDAAKYDLSLQREWLASQTTLANKAAVQSYVVPETIELPWLADPKVKGLDKEQLKTWEQWSGHFMPSGAFLAGRVDQQHWLSFGTEPQLPLLFSNHPLLMSDDASEAVVRIGVMTENKSAVTRKLGWSTLPAGQDVRVRMSGLLWPEAAQRVTNTAYLTREAKGNGQIIMFAGQPVVRGGTKGTERLLLNAIVYGPGLGAEPAIHL
ncbi:peptidase [Rheinheimera riviphila]|uniref:Peptidase n=1 Tax=Rheinheimera riviphila TaxID=1834037 RepID=A0A437QBH1_9GAMM|nr:M14 family metallopeptidase [Rheinheimera riviphila]RVU31904.1 peptidase [Rheinheimera riviphila]